jgi:hypothetical protein
MVGPDPLDFLTVPCGRTGETRPVTIKNAGLLPYTFTATLGLADQSPYVLDAATGSIPAMGTALVNVTPKPIPIPARLASNAYGDTLTIATNAPMVPPATVTLKESASGAILGVAMGTTDFGPVSPGGMGSLPFTVTNVGNLDAFLTVSVTGPGFSAALPPGGDLLPAGGTVSGNAIFSPMAPGPATGALYVWTAQVLCAPASQITLTAQGAYAVASFSSQPVTFAVTCGDPATPPGSLLIQNTGGSDLTITNVISALGRITITKTPGTIPAGQSGSISFTVNAPVIGTDKAGTYKDSLSFTTNEFGNPSYAIEVDVTVKGANLAFVDGTGSPITQVMASGPACSTPSFTPYGVANTGNVDVTVSVDPNDPYPAAAHERFGEPDGGPATFLSPQLVAAGAPPVYDSVAPRSNTTLCTGSDSFSFVVGGAADAASPPVCQGLPSLVVDYSMPQPCVCGC